MHIGYGILFGLLSATLQYGAFVFSSKFVRESGRGTLSLLAPAFLAISIPSLVALPFLAGPELPPLRVWVVPALLCSFFAIMGNGAVFIMLKSVDSSRVVPLLAVKVPMLALFCLIANGERYAPRQWLGVALVVPAAWLLCKAGKKIPVKTLAWLFLGSALFGASDYCIRILLNIFHDCGSLLRVSFLAFCAAYGLGGIFGALGMVCGFTPGRGQLTKNVLPFSFFWLVSIAVLFASFAVIGIVNGTIVQSSRGLIAVVLGWLVARAGFERIEEKVPRMIFIKRVVSAVLIILAMVLFNLK